MDARTKKTISSIYATKEGGKIVSPWLEGLAKKGLNPSYIVMDGEQSVMEAIRHIWPKVKIQRCLCHIQRQGMCWLRTYPKTEAARELRKLLLGLLGIKNIKEQDIFTNAYKAWLNKYRDFIKSLPVGNIAFKDLKRTRALISNALPDMFHYLREPNIPATTNAIESFHSRLKADYRRHRGLTQIHKIHYLKWYCFLKNSNTF